MRIASVVTVSCLLYSFTSISIPLWLLKSNYLVEGKYLCLLALLEEKRWFIFFLLIIIAHPVQPHCRPVSVSIWLGLSPLRRPRRRILTHSHIPIQFNVIQPTSNRILSLNSIHFVIVTMSLGEHCVIVLIAWEFLPISLFAFMSNSIDQFLEKKDTVYNLCILISSLTQQPKLNRTRKVNGKEKLNLNLLKYTPDNTRK